jgi:hypothetical protein
MRAVAVVGAAMIGLLAASSQGLAQSGTIQSKTIKECQREWQARTAAHLASGMTERVFMDQCRAGGISARAAASALSSPIPAATPAALSTRPVNKILCE